jgi:hypothetical protein
MIVESPHLTTQAPDSVRPGKPTRWLVAILGLAALLIPSGYFAWQYRSMPQLGSYHDDAVYWITARSLAAGHGYKIAHLPENPAQTKYPPLYPALLSLAPDLGSVTLLQWSFTPIYLILAWLYFRRCGFGEAAASGLTFILAIGPMTTIFAASPMTELPCSVVLLGVMLLIEKRDAISVRTALLAGALAAAGFLIRSNAIALAITVPGLFLYRRRQLRAAIAFAAPMFAAIVAWQGWCALHAFPAKDDILSYYTSYVGFYLRTFSASDLAHRLWVNFDAVIEWLARLVLFHVGDDFWIRPIAWLLTVAAVAGVVTLYRQGIRQYPLFAGVFVIVLLFWQYPPDQRFVYPLLPLYVAGLVTKLREVAQLAITAWRTKPGADRVAAVIMLTMILAVAGGSVGLMLHADIVLLSDYFRQQEVQRSDMRPVYQWIRANTAADERFAAYDDTLLYLNSARHGYTVAVLPVLVYGADPAAVPAYIATLPSLWREKHVNYLLVTAYDFRRDLHKPAQDSLARLVENRSMFQPVYADAVAQIYRFATAP